MKSLMPLHLLLTSVLAATTSSAHGAVVYTLGHGDLRPYYESGELKLRLRLDGSAIVNGDYADPINSQPVSFSLENVITAIPDVPLQSPDNRFDFTGAAVGDNLWLIPEGQPEAEGLGAPWLGFSTEEFDNDDTWMGNRLFMNLVAVAGPGHVSMFFSPEDELSPPHILFATLDGIDESDAYIQAYSMDLGISVGTHSHVNWAFSQPGIYDVTLKFSGEHSVDGYKEVTGVVRFAVATAVPEASSLTLLLTSVGGIGLVALKRRRDAQSKCRPHVDGT